MPDTRYRRAQVEYALWTLSGADRASPRHPMESAFRTRIKRLLEIDRALPAAPKAAAHAFSDDAPGGRGEDADFAALDALYLWVGLDLLGVGLKQQEVVQWLRGARRRFAGPFAELLSAGTTGMRPVYSADGAISFSKRGARDPRDVFLALSHIENPDTFPIARVRARGSDLHHGILIDAAQISDLCRKLPPGTLLLTAIGDSAMDLPGYLEEAPAPARGPKRRRS